jgi:hypothetical protein
MFSIAIVTTAIAIAIVTSAKTSHVSSTEATHVTSAEATHVTSGETTHVTSSAKAASANAAAPVSTTATATAAAATTTACLCSTRRKQRPGNQGRCQYHHRSSCSHERSFRGAEPSVIIELLAPASNGRPAPNGKLEISMAVIGAADGTGVSTEGDDADQPRRTGRSPHHRKFWFLGVFLSVWGYHHSLESVVPFSRRALAPFEQKRDGIVVF